MARHASEFVDEGFEALDDIVRDERMTDDEKIEFWRRVQIRASIRKTEIEEARR